MPPQVDDQQMALGRIYARAMLTVAAERGEEMEFGQELAAVGDALAQVPDFAAFANSPLVEGADRRNALEKVFRGKVSDLLADSLAVVESKGRLAALPAIVAAYREEMRARSGVIDAEVVSAVPISDGLREALTRAIGKRTGKQVQVSTSLDPDILGGLVVRTGDEKIDTSVATRLDRLSDRLAVRASEELISGRSFTDGSATTDGVAEEEE